MTFSRTVRAAPGHACEMLSRFVDAATQQRGRHATLAGGQGRRRDRHAPAARQRCARSRTSGCSIVDEEQRFGVSHKERLKQMRAHVDVLTMTATPIPRTLEMALTGIRQMSTIDTPPEDRQPVRTFVGSFDDELSRSAPSVASCCARARSSGSTTASRRSTGRRPGCNGCSPMPASWWRTVRWMRISSNGGWSGSGSGTPTSCSARRSSSRGSTCRTRTR